MQISDDLQINEDTFYGIMLCLSEATTNAIFHANKQDPEKLVTITVTSNGNEITFSIKDEGDGFQPEHIPDPTSPENLLKDSGRGLYLMNIYSKRLEFKSSPKGTETVLVFEI